MVGLKEIKETMNSLRTFKENLTKYKTLKEEVLSIQSKIEGEKIERSKINFIPAKQRRLLVEEKYKKCVEEFEMESLSRSDCKSIKDIRKYLENLNNSKLLQEKCLMFLKGNIEQVFGRTENGISQILILSKDIQPFFEATKAQEFHSDLYKFYRHALRPLVADSIPLEVTLCEDSKNFYVLHEMDEDFVAQTTGEFSGMGPVCLSHCLDDYSSLLEPFCEILRDNLCNRIILEEMTEVTVKDQLEVFDGTKFEVKSINEFMLDCSVKVVLSTTKQAINEEEVCFINPSGVYTSKLYFKIRKCVLMLNKLHSLRKQKAKDLIRKNLLRFFTASYSDKERLFIARSDLDQFLIEFPDLQTEQLLGLSEDLQHKLIESSTVLAIDLNDEMLRIKALIKRLHFEFVEGCEKFVRINSRTRYTALFFSSLYQNFINFVLKPKKYTKEAKDNLHEISKYLLEMSYNQPISLIKTYDSMVSLSNVLKSNIYELFEIYDSGSICLSKYDFKLAVKVLFEPSPQKDLLLEKI